MTVAAIGIKKTAWDGLNVTQRTILKWGLGKTELGSPARCKAGATNWYVFYDWRPTLDDIASLFTLTKGIATFPNYEFPTKDVLDEDGNVIRTVVDKAATQEDIMTYVLANRVDPDDVPLTEMVDVTVPVRVQVEIFQTDENGDPTTIPYDPPKYRWVDHPTDTHVIQVEQSLGDPVKLVADAQGAPNSIQAASILPPSFIPVEVTA